MAQKKLHLRVQNPNLNLDVAPNSTVKDLMQLISNSAGVSWDRIQIMDRSNFPPKTISTNPYLTLKELNIQNQTVLSVRKLDKAQNFDQYKPKAPNNQNINPNANVNGNANGNINNENKNNNSEEKVNNNNNNNNFGNNGRLIREKIADDNSCLFNAIQMCCDKTHKLDNGRTTELREMVASIILSDSDTYNRATLDNKSNNEYAQWIMNPKSWGGEIELSILSDILEITIVTIDVETLKLFTYGKEKGYKKTAYLCKYYYFVAFSLSLSLQ